MGLSAARGPAFSLRTFAGPPPAASFAEAETAAANYRRAARADNTRRAYRAVVACFTDWCAAHAQVPLPASPETAAAFIAAEAGKGLAVNTLRLRHAALHYLHLSVGWLSAANRIAAGQRHLCRHPPCPLPAVAQKDRPGARPVARHRPGDPRQFAGHRDRALILVGFAAALRPCELARLDIAALTRHEDGIALFLPWRKNDQEARDTTVWLPVGQTDLCPVRALEAWLAAAVISEGPLFRRL